MLPLLISLGLPFSTIKIVLKLSFYNQAIDLRLSAKQQPQNMPPSNRLRLDAKSYISTQNGRMTQENILRHFNIFIDY